jgi:hypothetical protein
MKELGTRFLGAEKNNPMHLKRNKITHARMTIKPSAKKGKKSSSKKQTKVVPKIKRKRVRKNVVISKTAALKKVEKEKNRYTPLDKWKGILSGHTAFIIGNGPSISSINLNLLDNYFTIGINRIFYIYDPTILFWQDRELWRAEKKNIIKQKAIKVSSLSGDPRHIFLNFRMGMNPFRFSMQPDKLYGRGNTGVIAAQFAVAIGCSNLVLLGIDCRYGERGKTDFYGKNKDHKPYTLKMCKNAMKWLYENCPVPIHNCGDVKFWPKQKLEDVIKELVPAKMQRKAYMKIFT